jgi:hypothetical protein
MATFNRCRINTFCVSFAIVTACLADRPVSAQESRQPVSRVRSIDTSISTLIERGLDHSPTLKRLVATVEASDGIVYLETGQCPGKVGACLLNWMVSSGGNRFLRVVLDRKRLGADRFVLAAVGHELQHAIEVLGERSVTNGLRMYLFYLQHAPTTQAQFETRAAVNAGLEIRTELSSRLELSER